MEIACGHTAAHEGGVGVARTRTASARDSPGPSRMPPVVSLRARQPMRVLGLSFSGHGTSACLVEDGHVVSVVNLERLTRVKFALATLPPYALPLAVVLKKSFGFDEVPPFADFYDVFPGMLRAVTG